MTQTPSFLCSTCGAEHSGIPTFGFDFPIHYLDVPEEERRERVVLTSDTCVIDDSLFFIRGCLEIPVHGSENPFIWGVWVSVSEQTFAHFEELFDVARRSDHGPFFGFLCSPPRPYPDSTDLKTQVHLRDDGMRPYVELEHTEHPLAVEQREGITLERVAEICELMVHGTQRAG